MNLRKFYRITKSSRNDFIFLKVFLVASFVYILYSQHVNAAEIILSENVNNSITYSITLEGEIEKGDLEKIKNLSKNKVISNIFLFSPGGNVQEAFKISDFMNENLISASAPLITPDIPDIKNHKGFNTCKGKLFGPKNQINCTCGSSCAFIWLLAPIRSGNIIGVHRPRFNYDDYSNMSLDEAKLAYEKMINLVKNKLMESQLNPRMIDLIMNTSSGTIRFLNNRELETIKRYSPYLDELLIAKCNIFVDELSRYNSTQQEFDSLSEIMEDKCLYEPLASSQFCKKIVDRWDVLFRKRISLEPKNFNKCSRSALDELRQTKQLKFDDLIPKN